MPKNIKRIGINEAYQKDPIKADLELFGRQSCENTRRGFLKKSSLFAMMAVVGSNIPFADKIPSGLIPAALANSEENFEIEGKEGLIFINDRPLIAETPPHLLDDDFTPAKHLFIKNNGQAPVDVDPNNWQLKIIADEDTAQQQTMVLTLDTLKNKYKHYDYALQIECSGNGRNGFSPITQGTPWSNGAVGCPIWTGVRLKDVLKDMGLTQKAIYIGYKGADTHLSGDPTKEVISRGIPIKKALDPQTLLAWAINGEDIPYHNGAPLRLVAGGWPASVSGKWLTELYIRDTIHDGKKMTGTSDRVPCNPISPEQTIEKEELCIIESMPVKSIITFPKTGEEREAGKPFEIRGKAWAGDLKVKKMYVSIDFGATWEKVSLEAPVNKIAWQKWSAKITLPTTGYFELWAKATDEKGNSQPVVTPGWNPRGYLNNSCHRIVVSAI